jgi:hypothetical protein
MNRSYAVSLDAFSKTITTGVALLFVGIGFGLFLVPDNSSDSNTGSVIWLLINLFNFSIFLFCYLFRPLAYLLSDENLTIRRLLLPRVFPYAEMAEVRQIPREDLRWTMRTFGNGGVFGYYGKFYHTSFGAMTWFASRRDHYVLVLFKDGRKIIVTPDDLNFVHDLSSRLSSQFTKP